MNWIKQKIILSTQTAEDGGKLHAAHINLDDKMEMYYNKELKCWCLPGEEEEKRKGIPHSRYISVRAQAMLRFLSTTLIQALKSYSVNSKKFFRK